LYLGAKISITAQEGGSIVLTKVLVIDDDIIVTNTIRDALHRNTFEVFIANSGTEGIELARQVEPEAIVLDLMMPGMNGWEVCRAIRAFSQVPILVLSAVVDPEMVTQALDEGANDYMVKPVAFTVLASRLKRLTQQARIDRKHSSTTNDS
jgi:DNA-binding response OmpR family regulator